MKYIPSLFLAFTVLTPAAYANSYYLEYETSPCLNASPPPGGHGLDACHYYSAPTMQPPALLQQLNLKLPVGDPTGKTETFNIDKLQSVGIGLLLYPSVIPGGTLNNSLKVPVQFSASQLLAAKVVESGSITLTDGKVTSWDISLSLPTTSTLTFVDFNISKLLIHTESPNANSSCSVDVSGCGDGISLIYNGKETIGVNNYYRTYSGGFGMDSTIAVGQWTLVGSPIPAAIFFVAPALAGVFGFSRRKGRA